MSKLHRPYIPLSVRVQVAERQIREMPRQPWEAGDDVALIDGLDGHPGWVKLESYLSVLFGDKPYALDHDPALALRKRRGTGKETRYSPPANDPRFLRYREAGPGSDHDIKTRVRGDGAQHSDLALIRIEKRRTAKRSAKYNRKYNWPSGRKLQSRGLR